MNSTPFYHSTERKQALLRTAEAWRGTPFRENAQVCGPHGGVDCVRYQNAVHSTTGALAGLALEVMPVEFARHWAQHHVQSRILDFFRQPGVRERVRLVDVGDAMIGDALCLQQKDVDQCVHHLALDAGPCWYQCIAPAGVVTVSSRDPQWRGTLVYRYRIFEEGSA